MRRHEAVWLVIGIAVCVTLPFAWLIAREYGGWWGAAYAFTFSSASAWLGIHWARKTGSWRW